MGKGPIIFVEDDSDDVELVTECLNQFTNFIFFSHADQALQFLHQNTLNPPSLVVSDCNLPGQNGVEFVESIRESKTEISSVKIVVLCGGLTKPDHERLIKADVTGIFIKPTRIEGLKEVVREIIEMAEREK